MALHAPSQCATGLAKTPQYSILCLGLASHGPLTPESPTRRGIYYCEFLLDLLSYLIHLLLGSWRMHFCTTIFGTLIYGSDSRLIQ